MNCIKVGRALEPAPGSIQVSAQPVTGLSGRGRGRGFFALCEAGHCCLPRNPTLAYLFWKLLNNFWYILLSSGIWKQKCMQSKYQKNMAETSVERSDLGQKIERGTKTGASCKCVAHWDWELEREAGSEKPLSMMHFVWLCAVSFYHSWAMRLWDSTSGSVPSTCSCSLPPFFFFYHRWKHGVRGERLQCCFTTCGFPRCCACCSCEVPGIWTQVRMLGRVWALPCPLFLFLNFPKLQVSQL